MAYTISDLHYWIACLEENSEAWYATAKPDGPDPRLAPDLLEALEDILEDYVQSYGGGLWDEEPSAMRKAREIIAQAKGEAG